jgi:hypothetical protein
MRLVRVAKVAEVSSRGDNEGTNRGHGRGHGNIDNKLWTTTKEKNGAICLLMLCAVSSFLALLPTNQKIRSIDPVLTDLRKTTPTSYAAMSMVLEDEERSYYNVENEGAFNISDITKGHSRIQSFNLQMEQKIGSTAGTAEAHADTAIIISSSWIPTHPSTFMVDTVVNSTINFVGLSPSTPIFITVDDIPTSSLTEEKQASLDAYVYSLYRTYMSNPKIHIMVSMEHWHIGGNVLKALQLIQHHYPHVQYLHYMQHDFEMARAVNHTALVQTMKDHPKVNYIRFKYKQYETSPVWCGSDIGDTAILSVSGDIDNATIFHTRKYSDNNHLVRFQWYFDLIKSMMYYKRAPELPSQKIAYDACATNESLGLYTYGYPGRTETPVLQHLDGRGTHARRRYLRWIDSRIGFY